MNPLLLTTLCKQLAAARRRSPALLEVLQILAEDEGWPNSVRMRIRSCSVDASHSSWLCDIPCDCLPFPPSAVALMVAAEREGILVQTLDALSDDFISEDDTRRAVRAAVFWPFTALVMLAFMLALAGLFLLPAFQKLYTDAGVTAPFSTRLLGTFIDWTVGLWWFWIPVVAFGALITVTRRWPRSVESRCAAVCFTLPFVRRYLTDRHVLRVARWLGVLAAGSTARPEILNYLRETQLVPTLQRSARQAEEALAAGASYSSAMALPMLPRRLSLFLRIGEATNDIGEALQTFLVVTLAAERESLARFERGVLLVSYLIVASLVAMFVSGIYGSLSYLASTL